MAVMFWPGGVGLSMEDVNKLILWPATFVVFWAGGTFHAPGLDGGRHRTVTMDTLVAVGTLAAWGYSVVVTMWPMTRDARGHRARDLLRLRGDHRRAHPGRALAGGAGALADGGRRPRAGRAPGPDRAPRPRGRGDRRAHRAGPAGRPAARPAGREGPGGRHRDRGRLVRGRVDAHRRVDAGQQGAPGDEVIGATLNTTGSFVFRATRVGRDTVLGQIVRMVQAAQGSKAPIQRMADAVSARFVPLVIGLAALTFAVWFVVGPEPQLTLALVAMITVLIIACPCAMGLATPTAIMVGTGKAAEAGILIRGGEALEAAGRVDTVIFDKTGTLTLGRPAVADAGARWRGRHGRGARCWRWPRRGDRLRASPGRGDRGRGARSRACRSRRVDGLRRRITGRRRPGAAWATARSWSATRACCATRASTRSRSAAAAAAIAAERPDAGAGGARTGAALGVIGISDPVKAEAAEAVRAAARRGASRSGW